MTNRSPTNPSFKRSQHGAALIVGMVLLLVLTLLAVAGMNTASLELLMAGNHQFHNRAFEASEAGVDFAYANAQMNPIAAYDEPFANNLPNSIDSYRARVRPVLDTAGNVTTPQAAPGFSVGTFAAYAFTIQSDGASSRNAAASHTQELYVVANAPAGMPPPVTPPGGPAPPPLQ